jgi:hypothetical protein
MVGREVALNIDGAGSVTRERTRGSEVFLNELGRRRG